MWRILPRGLPRADGRSAPRILDEARRRVEIAKAQKNAAEAQRTATAPRGADSSIPLSGLAESQAELAGAMARLEQARLVAPTHGTILLRTVEPGYTVV